MTPLRFLCSCLPFFQAAQGHSAGIAFCRHCMHHLDLLPLTQLPSAPTGAAGRFGPLDSNLVRAWAVSSVELEYRSQGHCRCLTAVDPYRASTAFEPRALQAAPIGFFVLQQVPRLANMLQCCYRPALAILHEPHRSLLAGCRRWQQRCEALQQPASDGRPRRESHLQRQGTQRSRSPATAL